MPTPGAISGNPPNTEQGILSSSKGGGPKQHGPFTVGSNLYLALTVDNGGGDFSIQIWKSTDAGVTWAEQDSANEPHILGSYSAILNGTKIELVYNSLPPAPLRRTTYQEFDTGTDTFSAADSAAAQAVGSQDVNGDLHATKLSNGDYVVFYTGTLGAVSILRTAGVWQAAVQQFSSGTPVTGIELIGLTSNPSDDTAYLLYALTNSAGPFNSQLIVRSLTTGGVLSAGSVVDSGNNAEAGFISQGNIFIWNSRIVVPGISGGLPGIWEGAPIGAPVWTFHAAGLAAPTPVLVLFLPVDATNALVWWTTGDAAAINVWNAAYDGATFDAPALFYDWNADPPAGGGGVPGADQFLKQPSVAAISGGYGLALAMAYNFPAEDYSTFFISAGSPLAITCDNPPDGTVAEAYSHFFPATGGTEPYTFAIIAGALPNGLTLNTATGEVSGNPTLAGIFTFTVQVTDANADTAEVECSITINPVEFPTPPTYWNPGTSESLLCEKNYPWVVPPRDAKPVRLFNSISAPAAGVTTELWSFDVPDGFWFVFDRIVFIATVTGYVDGSGSIFFILDVNTPIGAALPTARPIAKFTTQAGDLSEPVAVAPVQLYQQDTLRAKVLVNDPTLGVGLPNVIHAIVEGWLFPHSRNV